MALLPLLFLPLGSGCTSNSGSAEDPITASEALSSLELEFDLDARALMDSLFPASPPFPYRGSLLELNCFPMQGDLFWLLYDEPIMLYIDDRGY